MQELSKTQARQYFYHQYSFYSWLSAYPVLQLSTIYLCYLLFSVSEEKQVLGTPKLGCFLKFHLFFLQLNPIKKLILSTISKHSANHFSALHFVCHTNWIFFPTYLVTITTFFWRHFSCVKQYHFFHCSLNVNSAVLDYKPPIIWKI